MRAILPDQGTATAVVTMPPEPSAVRRQFSATGLTYTALVSTDEALRGIAVRAVNSLTIMTPFLNRDGMTFVLDLFRESRASERRLIIRRSGGARNVVRETLDAIRALRITVLDYTVPVAHGYETFHAKVVLADQDLAYVGSANMTVFARHSMELGTLMDGKAARVIANVIRAIERTAIPVVCGTE
jgi:hypothetical protein